MDKHCRICHNTSCSNHGKNISFLGEGWKCNYIPVPTNADRIRAMSDEELSGLIRVIYMSEECPLCTLECETCFFKEVCAGTYFGKEIEWLKQPTE